MVASKVEYAKKRADFLSLWTLSKIFLAFFNCVEINGGNAQRCSVVSL